MGKVRQGSTSLSRLLLTVLSHIPYHPKLVKVSATTLGTKLFLHDDRNALDVLAIEQRFNKGVGESQVIDRPDHLLPYGPRTSIREPWFMA